MFKGFTDATTDFLWNIRFNNEREWFNAHKAEYHEYYRHDLKTGGRFFHFGYCAAKLAEALKLVFRLRRCGAAGNGRMEKHCGEHFEPRLILRGGAGAQRNIPKDPQIKDNEDLT